MKKILSVVLALAMVFTLAACTTKVDTTYSNGLTKDGFYDLKALDYVTLPDLEGIEIPEEFKVASESEVEQQIQSLLDSAKTKKENYDKAIEDGDLVNIDYSGSIDGVAFDGGTAAGQEVTAGSSQFIDDFLTQIIGHKPGDQFDVEVTFPVPYENNPDLEGKDAVFNVVINHIVEYEYPEFDDEFVKQYFAEAYGVDTADEMKEYIENNIVRTQMYDYIDGYLFNNATLSEVPAAVKEHQENLIKANYNDTAAQYGVDIATLLSYYGVSTLDEMIEQSQDQINDMSKDILVYQAVAEQLGIKIANEDIADYFEEISGNRDYDAYKNQYGLPYLKMMVMTSTVADKLIEKSK